MNATVKQAIEIIKLQAYGAPVKHVEQYLKSEKITTVTAYHLTKTENVDSIRKSGINGSNCYNRNDAVYLFLDYGDVISNAPHIIGTDEYTVLTVEIPAHVAATIKDDGLFNGSFETSYSACRLEQSIPAKWIK